MNTFDLALDLDKRAGVTQWVTLRQGDHNGTVLKATIYDHGVQVGGGYTYRVSIRHPGTGETYYRETANYSNGVATVTIDEQYAAAIVGITSGYFELLQGSAVIASTEDFGVRILRSATDGAVPGEKYDSAIEDALAELDEATGRISQMVVDATEEYLEAHPEITTTVQDNSLTDAKLVQKGGILSRVERLWYRLANLLTATPAEADVLTVSDAAKTPLAGLSLYGRSTQDGTPTPDAPVAIESVEAPNLLPASSPSTTINGVTFTRNDDGSYTVKGMATANIEFDLFPASTNAVVLPAGSYCLRGCPAGGGNSMWKLDVRLGVPATPSTGSYSADYGSGAVVTRQAEFTINRARIVIYSGVTIDAVFAPVFASGSRLVPYVPHGAVGLLAKGGNLSPIFSVPIAAGGYWTSDSNYWTSTSDGWARFVRSVTVATNTDIATYPQDGFEVGQTYTVLLEWRNVSLTGTANMYMQADATRQLDAIASTIITAGSGRAYVQTTCLHGPTEEGITRFLYWRTRLQADSSLDGEFRLSIYKGEYAGEFQPYADSIIPIDLQGHVLRSLPDGTRDEVTVDQYGHAVLVKRVSSVTLDGSESFSWTVGSTANSNLKALFVRKEVWQSKFGDLIKNSTNDTKGNLICDILPANNTVYNLWTTPSMQGWTDMSAAFMIAPAEGVTTSAEFNSWLASHPLTVQYPLATPVTIDLGTIDPIALQGPDMTAQAVPTAPFELTYERDLNVTLARLEAAIADAATN